MGRKQNKRRTRQRNNRNKRNNNNNSNNNSSQQNRNLTTKENEQLTTSTSTTTSTTTTISAPIESIISNTPPPPTPPPPPKQYDHPTSKLNTVERAEYIDYYGNPNEPMYDANELNHHHHHNLFTSTLESSSGLNSTISSSNFEPETSHFNFYDNYHNVSKTSTFIPYNGYNTFTNQRLSNISSQMETPGRQYSNQYVAEHCDDNNYDSLHKVKHHNVHHNYPDDPITYGDDVFYENDDSNVDNTHLDVERESYHHPRPEKLGNINIDKRRFVSDTYEHSINDMNNHLPNSTAAPYSAANSRPQESQPNNSVDYLYQYYQFYPRPVLLGKSFHPIASHAENVNIGSDGRNVPVPSVHPSIEKIYGKFQRALQLDAESGAASSISLSDSSSSSSTTSLSTESPCNEPIPPIAPLPPLRIFNSQTTGTMNAPFDLLTRLKSFSFNGPFESLENDHHEFRLPDGRSYYFDHLTPRKSTSFEEPIRARYGGTNSTISHTGNGITPPPSDNEDPFSHGGAYGEYGYSTASTCGGAGLSGVGNTGTGTTSSSALSPRHYSKTYDTKYDPLIKLASKFKEDPEHEDMQDYRRGGYHPLQMFDVMNSRYTIIVKLGWGHFSTVWLAWDSKMNKFVAIKVVKSAEQYRDAAEDEIKILKYAGERETVSGHAGSYRVVKLLDNFRICGINGTHVCMVFEVLGHNLLKLIVKSNYRGIPLENVQTIIRQVLLGLSYLHGQCGIIHTDIKPENVLLVVNDDMAQKLAFRAFYMVHHKIPLPLVYRSNAPTAKFFPTPVRLEGPDTIKKMNKKKKNQETKKLGDDSMENDGSITIKSNNDPSNKEIDKKVGSSIDPINKSPKRTVRECSSGSKRSKSGDKTNNDDDGGVGGDETDTNSDEIDYIDNIDSYRTFDGQTYPNWICEILESGDYLLQQHFKKFPDPTFDVCDVSVKIGDLGNACWVNKHFCDDIQTRQYRSPEVIVGAGYDTSADMWSVACLAYELATGDYLFDPKKSRQFSRDEDHLARIIELLGPVPLNLILNGKFSKQFFTSTGDLRFQVERYSLFQLLTERQQWPAPIAKLFADFLQMMLRSDPNRRATADQVLQHPFMRDSFDFSEMSQRYERESYYSRSSSYHSSLGTDNGGTSVVPVGTIVDEKKTRKSINTATDT